MFNDQSARIVRLPRYRAESCQTQAAGFVYIETNVPYFWINQMHHICFSEHIRTVQDGEREDRQTRHTKGLHVL